MGEGLSRKAKNTNSRSGSHGGGGVFSETQYGSSCEVEVAVMSALKRKSGTLYILADIGYTNTVDQSTQNSPAAPGKAESPAQFPYREFPQATRTHDVHANIFSKLSASASIFVPGERHPLRCDGNAAYM